MYKSNRVVLVFLLIFNLVLLSVPSITAQQASSNKGSSYRFPAVPLATHDPYFSIWSMRDTLTEDNSKHWTGHNHSMTGMVRIDGVAYRFMGEWAKSAPIMKQIGMELTPTRTIYQFETAGIRLTLTFMSPLLPFDLDIMSRPVTYVTFDLQSIDNRTHDVSLYFDCTAEWSVNTASQKIRASRHKIDDIELLSFGTVEQPILEKSGDNLRIDWGYQYLVVPTSNGTAKAIGPWRTVRKSFIDAGTIPTADDMRMPREASDDLPVIATTINLGKVGSSTVSRYLMVAYDDIFSIEYFHRKLPAYWRRNGQDFGQMIQHAARDYSSLIDRCNTFDKELMEDLKQVGGEEYAILSALAFRQTIAAHKLVVDIDGSLLFLSKENFSNGSINTVDVTYPSAPFFLLFNPKLLKGQLTPILEYAQTPRWRFPFAPHDLGVYPLANGQKYGGGERTEDDQMPVEESGNMLLMIAAIAKIEGNANYAKEYWPLITKWAEYLKEKGMDPENQLCTDDFAGHLAHNTNLSLKAILALGSYGMLCDMLGRKTDANSYRNLASDMANRWVKMADDGDHFRLAFDKPGTWSQKYNLVWDRLLGLNLFPREVAQKEMNFYKRKINKYGLPLDNRSDYTKLDWIVWTATLADSPEDFRRMVLPLYAFITESPSRVPLTDWYWTTDGKQVGFQARSVVGGIYIPVLKNGTIWKKWATKVIE